MKLLDRIFSFHKRTDDNLHYESAMQNIQLRKSMLYPILQSRLHTRLLKERDLSALQSRAA